MAVVVVWPILTLLVRVQLASKLGLKKHRVLEKSTGTVKELHLPVDAEVHVGTDGRLYLLDTARCFPPTARWPGAIQSEFHFLTNHCRPELLKAAQQFGLSPVSSDVLSKFGKR